MNLSVQQINFLHRKTRGYSNSLRVEMHGDAPLYFKVHHVKHEIHRDGWYKVYTEGNVGEGTRILDEGVEK